MGAKVVIILTFAALFSQGLAKSRSEPTCPEGSTPSPFDPNACYKVISNATDYFSAQTICQNANGQLTSVHSSFENQFLLGIGSGSGADTIWIGGANANVNATWVWDDNSPFDYTDWAAGQPSSNPGNCISLHMQRGGYWFAEKCNAQKPFICKILPSKPGQTSCPSGWSFSSTTKDCYKAFKGYTNMTCNYARQLCSSVNATVVSIHSFRENSFVAGMIMDPKTPYAVIGLISDGVAWRWQDNTLINYTQWSGSAASQPNGQSCIIMGGFSQYDDWYAFQYTPAPQAVCKLSGYENIKKSARDSICPAGTIEGTVNPNTCYKVYPNAMNWYSAEQACQKGGGHLISIHNALENWFFVGIIDNNVPKPTDFWIGGSNDNSNATWGWIDGTPFDFDNWAPGNPQNTTKLCMYEQVRSGFWYSSRCDEGEKPFICSVPPSSTPRNSCPADFSYFHETNSCYRIVQVPRTTACSEIRQICFNLNSTVASIHSYAENYFIAGLAVNDTVDYQSRTYTAIGLVGDGNVWKWLDGTFVNYTYWATTYLPYSGDCALSYSDFYSAGEIAWWYTASNIKQFSQVACKIAAF